MYHVIYHINKIWKNNYPCTSVYKNLQAKGENECVRSIKCMDTDDKNALEKEGTILQLKYYERIDLKNKTHE